MQFVVASYQGIQTAYVLSECYESSQLKNKYRPKKMFGCLAESVIAMREIASSLGSIESTEKIIKEGQGLGLFHKGNANLMSKCFWASVQGIMEEMAADKEMKAPEPEWIISMLREWNGGEK